MDFCYGHLGNGSNLIFMLITGYFLFGREITCYKRIRTIENLLFAVLLHGIISTGINFVALKTFYPIETNDAFRPLFTLPNWFSGENLWYLQAYGMFILFVIPLLKTFEKHLTRYRHRCLMLTILFARFLAFSKYLPNLWLSSRIIDFIMCYYIGGYISKYGFPVSITKLLFVLISYLIVFFLYDCYWRYTCSIIYSPIDYSYIDVTQPLLFCLCFALLFFLIFDKIDINSYKLSRITSTLSSTTIGIYIFHYYMVSFFIHICQCLLVERLVKKRLFHFCDTRQYSFVCYWISARCDSSASLQRFPCTD